MTTYGVRLRDSAGSVVFDTSDTTWRITKYLSTSSLSSDTDPAWPIGHVISTTTSNYETALAVPAKWSIVGNTISFVNAKCAPFCLAGTFAYYEVFCMASSDPSPGIDGYGIAAINAAGDYVLDGFSEQFHLMYSGSATVSGATNTVVSITWDSVGTLVWQPMIFVSIGQDIAYAQLIRDTSNYKWKGFRVRKLNASTSTLYYRVYARASDVPASGHGMKLYRSDGRVIFNSNKPLLKVGYINTAAQVYGGNSSYTHSVSGGYVLINNIQMALINGPSEVGFRGFKNTGGTVTFTWTAVPWGSSFSLYPDWPFATCPPVTIVVDKP